MKRLTSHVLLLTVVLCLSSACRTIRPLSDNLTLDGHPAKKTVVVVPEAFSFTKPTWGSDFMTLPRGVYTPILEDDHGGVYFQSPTKIGGQHMHDGGVYLKSSDPESAYVYILVGLFGGGKPRVVEIPPDVKPNFKFIIERKQ